MPPDRLVYMANQIGRFFESQGSADAAAAAIADHLAKFWAPPMRAALLAYAAADGAGLDPTVRSAVAALAAETAPI